MAVNLLGKDGFYGWVNLAVMFVFYIAVMLMLAAFGVFLPFWVKEFSWSRGLIAGAQTVAMILSGVAAPAVGMFIMKYGSRKAIVLGNLMCAVGLFMLAFQTSIWELYLWSGIVVGLGMSIGGMLAMMTVINNWFVMKRSVALAISMASMGLSGIVLIPGLMALINTIGWRRAYMMVAAFVFLCCVLLPGLLIKNKPEDIGQVPDGPVSRRPAQEKTRTNPYKNLYRTPVDFTAKEALRTRALWLLVSYGTLQFLASGGLFTHQIAFLFDLGLAPGMAAVAAGVMGAVMSISQLGIGFLGLRFKMHSLAVISILIAIVGFTVLIFARSWPLVLAYSIILGIAFGIQSIAMGNLFPDYFGRSEFPKIMGFTMPFTTIISSMGAPLTGFIRDAKGSYIPAFQISLALLVVAFFCILFAKPPVHPSLKKGPAAAAVGMRTAD